MATNFQCITESPEKLAEFLEGKYGCSLLSCPAYLICNKADDTRTCGEILIEWLQEECDE